MHIEFTRVILHNFMSFGHADIRFNDDGFVKVTGINENPLDNAGSNGSGKSSLWEAIIWAITGETIRGTKHVVNMFGDDGCYVEAEFYIDKTRYQIIRSKDHQIRKTSIQILINGEDVSGKGLRDSEKILQQYLPDLTASLLGSVIILGQGLPQKFTNNTPSGRKEVLEKLSKSDFMIEDLKKRVSERKSELQTNLRNFEDALLSCKTKETFLQKQIDDNEELLKTLDSVELTKQLQDLKNKNLDTVEKLEVLEANKDIVSQKYDDVTSSINELNNKKNQDLYSLLYSYQEKIQPYKNALSDLNAESNSIKKQLTQIKSIKDVCPTCGQKIPDVHKPETTMLEVDLEIIQVKISETEKSLKSFDTQYKLDQENINSLFLNETQSLYHEQEELNNTLKQLKFETSKLTTENNDLLSQISSVEIKLAQIQSTIDNCNRIIRENNENLTVMAQQILYNNTQKDLTQSHLEVISKFDTALKRDFRGYLLSTVIDYIQCRAKQYCNTIFNNDNITFCLDGNNIDISYMNKAYENLSGGEKQKIDLIIQFSIRDMLTTHLSFTSNILVLDEVFDGLDMIGCTKVIDMISSLSDIKNIFIVTHRKDLSIPTDKEVIVVKSSAGISEIRV